MQNYAIDKTDDRDYSVEVLLGAEKELPKSKIIGDDEIQNQSLQYKTRNACVFYTGSSVSNTMNYLNGESTRISGLGLSKIALEKKYLSEENGAWVVHSPVLLKELGYITAYAICKSLYEVKLSIFNNKPVQTGSNQINRSETSKKGNIAKGGGGSAHSFFICGYDDDKEILICENSYGKEKYNHGYFFIKYSDYKKFLFRSQYVMTDKRDAQKEYKEKIREEISLQNAKEFYDRGITNGLNPNENITRQELWATLEIVMEKTEDKMQELLNNKY